MTALVVTLNRSPEYSEGTVKGLRDLS